MNKGDIVYITDKSTNTMRTYFVVMNIVDFGDCALLMYAYEEKRKHTVRINTKFGTYWINCKPIIKFAVKSLQMTSDYISNKERDYLYRLHNALIFEHDQRHPNQPQKIIENKNYVRITSGGRVSPR